jgi:hypothetical protein
MLVQNGFYSKLQGRFKKSFNNTHEDITDGVLYQQLDRLFTVLRPAQEYFTYMETSPLPVKGGKI